MINSTTISDTNRVTDLISWLKVQQPESDLAKRLFWRRIIGRLMDLSYSGWWAFPLVETDH